MLSEVHAKDLLNKYADKFMIRWSLQSFCNTHPSLLIAIVRAIQEANIDGQMKENVAWSEYCTLHGSEPITLKQLKDRIENIKTEVETWKRTR